MLNILKRLEVQYAVLIAAGFLAVLLLYAEHDSFCAQSQGQKLNREETDRESHAPSSRQAPQDKPKYAESPADSDYSESRPSWKCDYKPGDLGLGFFTYCLVVIGWAAIRSSEKTVRDLERTHIFCGPDTRTANPDGSSTFRINLSNSGKTPGFIKAVYAEFPEDEPTEELNYKTKVVRRRDLVLPPGHKFSDHGQPPTFKCSRANPKYIIGFIKYEDIFRQPHMSKFCVSVDYTNGEFTPVGPPALNDYD